MESGNLNFLEPSGPVQICNGTALPLPFYYIRTLTKIGRVCKYKVQKQNGFWICCRDKGSPSLSSPTPTHFTLHYNFILQEFTITSPSPKSLNVCSKYSITLQGFEDCRLLDQLLLKYNDISVVLKEFSAIRNTDAESICDLAMYNYLEVILYINQKIFLILLRLRPMGCSLLQNKFLKDFKKIMWWKNELNPAYIYNPTFAVSKVDFINIENLELYGQIRKACRI